MFSDPSQLWKFFENGTLLNKKTNKTDDDWIFEEATEKNWQNEILIRIKKKFDNTTLLGGFGSKAIANETFVKDRHVQLWKRGQSNKEGYYSLKNSESQKFMTSKSTDSFWLEGKSISTCIYSHVQNSIENFVF